MAISFEAKADIAPIGVEDFVHVLQKAYKGNSIEAMHAVADKLQSVAANREFVRDALLAEVKRIARQKNLISFAPQSFIIYRDHPFSLRLNLWLPPVGSNRKIEQEARVYSYERAHDHNFSLLTVGAGGPGYKTRILEYDCESVSGYAGERVEMTFLEDTMLPLGKAMIYRPHQDIHVQLPPEQPSLSLNLLIEEKEIVERPQYFFDLTAKSLVIMNDNEVGRRVSFLEAVGQFADEDSVSLLFDIARQNGNPLIRVAALDAIRTGFPELQREIEKIAEADTHSLVQHSRSHS